MRYFIPLATLAMCAPLLAQTPSTQSVTLVYSGGPNNSVQTVTFGGGTITTARISQNIDQNGNPVTAASPNSAVGVFVFNNNATQINFGLDSGVLTGLAQRGQNTYTGTTLVSSSTCTDCISITLNLQIG